MKNLALILGAFAGGVPGNPVYTPAPPMQTTSYLPPVEGDGWNKADTNGYQTGHQSELRIINADGQLYICNLDNCQIYQPDAFGNNHGNIGSYGVPQIKTTAKPVPQIKTTAPDHGLEHEQNSVLGQKSVQDQNPSLNNQNTGQEHGQKTDWDQDSDQDLVLKTSKTEPEESSDFEIIDAVVVFDDFDCDLHEFPSVEDAQEKIQKYFFSTVYRFNGLKSLKIIKRAGEKTRRNPKCDSMIVHYQATVLKSSSQSPDYFEAINERIARSFESHGYQIGYSKLFNSFYAFTIPDFIHGLINDLQVKEIDAKIDLFDDKTVVEYRKLLDDSRKPFPVEETNPFLIAPVKYMIEKTRDDKKMEKRIKIHQDPSWTCVENVECTKKNNDPMNGLPLVTVNTKTVIDKTHAWEQCKNEDDELSCDICTNNVCNYKQVFISQPSKKKPREEIINYYNGDEFISQPSKEKPRRDITNYEAIKDLIAVLGEDEFMNKFLVIGNKKIATEIAQDKSDKEKKLEATLDIIWKFVEDKVDYEVDPDSVARAYVDHLKDLQQGLAKEIREILNKQNESVDKITDVEPKEQLDFMKDHKEKVNKYHQDYTKDTIIDENKQIAKKGYGIWYDELFGDGWNR